MENKINSTMKEIPNYTLDIYKNIFENSFDGILLIDNNFRHIDANQSACSILGYSKDELNNMGLRDIVTKNGIEYGKMLWKELLEKGSQKGEYKLLTKDGKEINIEYHALANIEPGIHLFFMKDITEKKKIELNMLKEREMWFTILNDLPVYICIQDPDREIVFANKNLEENFGPIEGRKCHEIFFGNKDKTKEPCSSCDLLQLFENKKVITRENTYVNGRTYFVYDYSFVDTHDNKFVLELGIDITERKRVEDQLKNTSIQLEEIIEFLPDATFIIDKNKKVITWNRAIEEMTGVPKEDILGKSHDYVAVPFYGERRPFIADLVFEDNLDIKSKYSLIKKKGNSLYAEAFTPALYDNKGAFIWAIASPLLDHEGNVIGVIEAVRDITERVKAEESLRESREKYKKLADSLPEIVFETDEKGNLLFVNKNTFNITGYTEEDLKKGVNAIEFVIPEEREKVREKIQKILRGEKTTAGEYTALRKNGSTFPMIIHSNVVMMDEKPIGIRGIIFDVTEKKKAEEQIKESERTLKTILAAAPAGIKLVINRQIVWCNNRILEITGYPFEELKDRDLRFLYDNDEDYNKVGKILYEKWTNESYREVETRWKQKNGNLIDCHIRSSPLDLNDYSKGMIEVVTNITGSKKAQRQLEENMEYFAHLIDNIRNPLAIISGYLQVDGENQEIRDRIKKQIERIEDVLRQLDEGWMDTDDTRKFLKKHLD